MVIMNDSGTSHDFIIKEVVKELRLPLSVSLDYGLVLGTVDMI